METKQEQSHQRKLKSVIALACVVALILSLFATVYNLRRRLDNPSVSAIESFTAIMNAYTHSFSLFSQLLQQEISTAQNTEEIEAYLKKADSKLKKIEGEDFDGVYMYYQGRYLYSWDTPYSVYEESGYQATTRPWYTGAVAAKGEVYFSDPYRSYANDYMLATISQLLPDGKTVIAYDIKLGTVQTFVDNLEVFDGSLNLLCDMAGNIIGSTDPLYTGGNYALTQEQLENEIIQTQKELSQSSGDKRKKAEAKIASEQALQSFCVANQKFVTRMLDKPQTIRCNLNSGTFGYAYTNGRYTCLVFIPFIRVFPMTTILWIALFLLFTLGILLMENMMVRIRTTREIENKNKQLAEAVVRADAASVAKSQFLAQMSHEIRTPMNAIIGLTSIAKTEVRSPEKVNDYLTKIESSSKLLLSIINDVLDMSAIEGGKLKIDSAEFNFRNMLTNITTVFYEQAKHKSIRFEVRMNGVTEETIIGDQLRVNQVLMNLLSNAVKFTPAGGEIDLMVLQASHSQGKVQLRFSVSDTGCGMSAEMMGRLFKPFEQESASTARKHGGSGLGLSITKRLVEMMGGSIQVQSTLGKGSVFTVDIPFGVEKNEHAVETTGFSNIRTLVVDDDEDSCEYSGILLERLGVRHEYVTSGDAALEALGEAEDEGDPFTLCLIDWKMPGMDGGELTQQIRDIFGEDAIIIIVSAYDLNEVEASGRAIGSNYFIPKPLFQSTLFNALMRISGGDYTQINAQQESTEYDFTGKRVLIAEDVALNMEVAVKLLSMVGIDVTCAEDGRQAVELYQKSALNYYDCILMDINMPVMDGYEATKAIRQCTACADAATIPIYAMTANAFSEDVTAALNAGMNGHIAKPIETAVLYKTLETAFQMSEQNHADQTSQATAEGEPT